MLCGAPTKGDEYGGGRCRLGMLKIQHHNNCSEDLRFSWAMFPRYKTHPPKI
jgi:hypothetical protein